MAETKKITKKDNFNEIIKVATELGRTDLVEFATKEIALLEKKSANKAPTKTQVANESFKAVCREYIFRSEVIRTENKGKAYFTVA